MAIIIDPTRAQHHANSTLTLEQSLQGSFSSISNSQVNLDESLPEISSAESIRSKMLPKELCINVKNDGQGRRELLRKGKEGSRRRKRYENANFLNVPNSQPPLPSDWEVHPTYPVRNNVPYYLAYLWDSKFQETVEERRRCKTQPPQGKVSQDLKVALKKARGARYLLQDLECNIRAFIQQAQYQHCNMYDKNRIETDSEDDEIVFIGRYNQGNGITMSDEVNIEEGKQIHTECLVFESRKQGGGGFMRWLVHTLAEYYGLESRSEGREEKHGSGRNIIVRFRDRGGDFSKDTKWVVVPPVMEMPRPLWGLV